MLVLDSGVEASHPALAGSEIGSLEVVSLGRDGLAIRRAAPVDQAGHGTAVAGIVRRWAPGARLDVLDVFPGPGLSADSTWILAGLRWGISSGYQLINCSLGSDSQALMPEYKQVIDQAYCRNTWIVAAANNLDPDRLHYPAHFPTVLGVDAGQLPPLRVARRMGKLVELVAAGIEVDVAWPGGGHRKETGTSFAAAHLCALAARLRQLRPGWNACQVKAALYDLAEPGHE